MILLDAFALVALLGDEPAAGEVAALLREGECAVTAVNFAETLDVSVRVLGQDPEVVRARLLPLRTSVLGLVDVGEAEAREAARLRWTYYDRRTAALSLADCLLLAAAHLRGAAVATSDPPLAAAARRESVAVVALPGSTGTRP